MTKLFTSTALCLAFCSSAAFASGPGSDSDKIKKAPKAAQAESTLTIHANSTGQLQRAYTGLHVDNLPEEEESTKAVDDPNRIICKRVERMGSRLRKRKVCGTKKEWDQQKADSVQAVRLMQVTRGVSD